MRPKKSKVKKQKRKTHKKNKLQRNNKMPCYIHSIETSDIDSINQIIRDHKYQLKDVRKKWKVVPKDSCEVYKNRRKRQVEQNERDSEEHQDKSDERPKGRRGRQPLKRDSRGRFLPASSKCSCCTRTISDTESTNTRSEPACD